MSLSRVDAKDRARALGRFPGVTGSSAPAAMPSSLVYQLALTRAEAGEYDAALALFKGRFFPSEEGGVSATQVMFEIELMKAGAEAAAGQCASIKELLSKPQPGLALNGAVARAYFREALQAQSCKLDAQSRELLEKAADSKNSADAAWAAKASRLLGREDAQQKQNLEASLASADRVKDTSSYTGWWWYNMGTIEAELHHNDRALAAFRKALLLPDSLMSHHLSRAAIAELDGDSN
jgi:tetratricopeptide (TPR) repeat protein